MGSVVASGDVGRGGEGGGVGVTRCLRLVHELGTFVEETGLAGADLGRVLLVLGCKKYERVC